MSTSPANVLRMIILDRYPILPTVAMYVKKLGGPDNWMTATVLTAQVVMVPVTLLAGRSCDSWGRKPVMAIAFWVLPVRIASYGLVSTPSALVWLNPGAAMATPDLTERNDYERKLDLSI